MKKNKNQIDLVKMLLYIVRNVWLVVLCAEIGFGAFYMYVTRRLPETYTAAGTMYVSSYNPNMIDEEYMKSGDLSSSSQLIKTLMVIIKRDSVMKKVTDRVSETHPGISLETVSSSLSMESVSDTGVVAVISTTQEAQLSADIVNAVMESAPDEIARVVGVGNVDIMDYAVVPVLPNDRKSVLISFQYGAAAGAALAAALLAILYVLNQKITNINDLKNNYRIPILASIRRTEGVYTLVGKERRIVVITSSVSGEGKSTISSNLAISCSMSGKKVLLVDGDMRRSSQSEIFKLDGDQKGLSDAIAGRCKWENVILKNIVQKVDLLPAGHIPPNPAELLESDAMGRLLEEANTKYDLVLLDMPPVDIVADPLAVSAHVAGCIFVVRQNFTTHPDIRKALAAVQMTNMNVLGFVFYGEHLHDTSYYSRKYYKNYYKNSYLNIENQSGNQSGNKE